MTIKKITKPLYVINMSLDRQTDELSKSYTRCSLIQGIFTKISLENPLSLRFRYSVYLQTGGRTLRI